MDNEELLAVIEYAQNEISQILSICGVMSNKQREKLLALDNYLYKVIEEMQSTI